MKTAIHIGDTVMVASHPHCYYGVVKGKHLFTYDVFHLWERYDSDYDEVISGTAIKRIPKWKVFWSAKDEFEKYENKGD